MKLTDLLRNAAEQAPVSEHGLSTDSVMKRVKRGRSARATANGTVALGVLAVLGAGIAYPISQRGAESTDFDVATAAREQSEAGLLTDEFRMASSYGVYACGEVFTETRSTGGETSLEIVNAAVEDGSLMVNVSADWTSSAGPLSNDASVIDTTLYLLNDDVVVGSYPVDSTMTGSDMPFATFTYLAIPENTSVRGLSVVAVQNVALNAAVEADATLPSADQQLHSLSTQGSVQQNVSNSVSIESSAQPAFDGATLTNEELCSIPLQSVGYASVLNTYSRGLTDKSWDTFAGTQRVTDGNLSQVSCEVDGTEQAFSVDRFLGTSSDINLLNVISAPATKLPLINDVVDINHSRMDIELYNPNPWVISETWGTSEESTRIFLVHEGLVVADVSYLLVGVGNYTDGIWTDTDSATLAQGDMLKQNLLLEKVNWCGNLSEVYSRPGNSVNLTMVVAHQLDAFYADDTAGTNPASHLLYTGESATPYVVWTSLGDVVIEPQ